MYHMSLFLNRHMDMTIVNVLQVIMIMKAVTIPVYSMLPSCAIPESVCIADDGKIGMKISWIDCGKSSVMAGRNITANGITIPDDMFLEKNVAQTVRRT